MLAKLRRKNNKAQSVSEYALIAVLVVSALMAMAPMIQRASQGAIKTVADQLELQEGAEQEFGDDGYMVETRTTIVKDDQKIVLELPEFGSGTAFNAYSQTQTNTLSRMGVVEVEY